ncbi:peptidase A4-like protein [Rudaeicoccus suwonensis]|uniref:Peptidase A4-like protein n=2 Tax=Rudaeicoccus suwonensis TaxID=657409 RepID=A0A561E3B9_9MICO|nr:peptidase A4-like protein [Rudaeicoccus suwonensis]
MTRMTFRVAAVTAVAAMATIGMSTASAHPSAAAAAPRANSAVAHRIVGFGKHFGHATNGATTDYNWAGYAQTGANGSAKTTSATWTVPTLSTKYNGYSSTWVGVDGFNNSYLTQTGTEADVVNGQVQYDAWWEVITPSDEAPETLFSTLTVKPGDSITASVTTTGSKSTMKLVDNTTGKSASHTASYKGPGSSAEWIQEDTDVNGDISAAPDWHSITFSNILRNGANPDLQSSQSLDIVDQNGTQETSTSAPNSAGNGFTTTWLATGTPTPVD